MWRDPSGHCSVTGESVDDIEGNATGSDGLCWSIFYTLQEQGISGLDYRWNYTIDKEWIKKNRINYDSTGTPPHDSAAPTKGAGYQLLTYGGQAALVNGQGVYHVYLDEYGGSITAGIVAGQLGTASSVWIAHNTYKDQRRYESKLLPYNVYTDGDLQKLIKGIDAYRQQVNDANMDRLQLGLTGSAVFAAGAGVVSTVKKGLSGLASVVGLTADLTTLGSAANDAYQDHTKPITAMEELYDLFDTLPEID